MNFHVGCSTSSVAKDGDHQGLEGLILVDEEIPELVVPHLSHVAVCKIHEVLVALQKQIQHLLSDFSKCRLV